MNNSNEQISLKAYAKINLSLYITGVRDDGYHLLDSVFLPVGLYDEVVIKKADEGIVLSCGRDIPNDERNTAYKAASAVMSRYDIGGVQINITKNIPSMAGLGGGSSDAAAVLIGMNELYNLNITNEALEQMALNIGADVPFFIMGEAARVQGIGEIISPVDVKDALCLVLIKPEESVSTVAVYKKYDELKAQTGGGSQELISELGRGDAIGIAKLLHNDLQQAAADLCPQVDESISYLIKSGAIAAKMTGSGSCVFGIFNTPEEAQKAAAGYNLGGKAYFAKSVKKPVELV